MTSDADPAAAEVGSVADEVDGITDVVVGEEADAGFLVVRFVVAGVEVGPAPGAEAVVRTA